MNLLNRIIFIAGILFFFISSVEVFPQDNKFLNRFDSSKEQRSAAVQIIFDDIEEALSKGNVAVLSNFFGSQTYFSLSNGISGYYSSNQAYYVLEDFFKIYNVTSFRFKNISTSIKNPYATGIYSFEFKGKKDSAQVYISLKHIGNSWKITQITIN